MHLGATTIDLTPWSDPATMPVPTSGLRFDCPGPGCGTGGTWVTPDENALLLATSNACTCQPDGTCAENGNSCSYAAPGPNGPVPVVSTQLIKGVSNTTLLLIGAGVAGLIFIGGRRR